MKTLATIFSAIAITGFVVHPASGQLLGGGAAGSAAAKANSQRTQAQVQERVQAQAEQRVRAQVQSRIQVEAARAANIAHAATVAAQRQSAAAQHRASGIQLNANANVSAQGAGRVAGNSVDANTEARLGLQAGLLLPPDVTEADLKIYDNIFGRFNPLRRQPAPETAQTAPPQQAGAPASEPQPAPTAERDPRSQRPAENSGLALGHLDLASRIDFAVSQRRAEVSQQRDRALATGNAELLLQADHMEETLNVFLAAQQTARSQAEATTASRPNLKTPSANLQGQAQADAQGTATGQTGPRTAALPGTSAEGTGGAQGAANGTISR